MKIGPVIVACGAIVLTGPVGFAAWTLTQYTVGISGDGLSDLILATTVGVYLVMAGLGVLQAQELSIRLIRDLFSSVTMVGGWATAVAGMVVHFGWVFWLLLALTLIGMVGGTALRCPQCGALISFPKGRRSLPTMSRDLCPACGSDLNAPLQRKTVA